MAHILVIDDDEDLRDLLSQYLMLENHEVTTASDGLAGIQLVKSEKFDLIITDIIMPNKDGIEFILDLLDDPDVENTPIIAMSGGKRKISSEFNLVSASTLGVKAILKKPFTSHELYKSVKSALT